MRKRKTLDQLTLMDDYMFYQVMKDPDRMKRVLEWILNITITKLEYVVAQKTEKEGYDSKAIRLDLYVTDDRDNIYNVEVQSYKEDSLPKRIRYYQSVIDVDILTPGAKYEKLKKSYVVFFYNYDPFERNRYIYTFENRCLEEPDLSLGDETTKIVLCTKGTRGDIKPELREMLSYLDNGTVDGEFSRELDDAVNAVKNSEERRHEYAMIQLREQELLEEGREEGREEGKEEGSINTLVSLVKKGILTLHLAAAEAGISEEDFSKKMQSV